MPKGIRGGLSGTGVPTTGVPTIAIGINFDLSQAPLGSWSVAIRFIAPNPRNTR
jgi:hypothetical protein